MRRLLILLAVSGCAADLDISTTADPLTGGVSGTAAFPSTQVGQTSAAQSYSIYESPSSTVGDHVDDISNIAYNCPDFTVNWSPGDTEAECVSQGCLPSATRFCTEPPVAVDCTYFPYTFSAVFHPTVAAGVSCPLTITTSSSTLSYTLTGTGTAPPIHVGVSPTSAGFGGVRINTASSAIAFSVGNSGGTAATVSVSVSPAASAGVSGYTITSGTTSSHGLAANSSEAYTVTCTPVAVGTVNGTLTIASNDPTNPTLSVGLTCSGISSNVAVTPSPIALANTRVGEPVMQTVTIENTGAASATIASVSITGMTMVSAPPANTVLQANGTTNAVISFAATDAGSASGNLHIDTDTNSLDIPITARALATSMSLTPDGAVDFGPVCAGQTKMQTFSLVGNSDGPFKLTAVSSPDMPFAVATPTLPASVDGDAGNVVMFTVTAAPTDAGSASSTIGVTTDIPNGTPDMITLAVTALPAGASATPATLDLGPVVVQTTTLGQTVSLSNCGNSSINVTGTEITGDDATDFSIVQNPASTQVDAEGSATWLLVMNAQTPGTKNATFEIDYDSGSAFVALTGEPFDPTGSGSGAAGSGTDDKSSYYACSTGHAVALWPIALALLALRRRRR